MEKENYYWADFIADNIINKNKKSVYICASGISPSGNIHIGNFREIITTDLVVRALRDKGKKVRFIYSWDNFDRFRKTPKNLKINLDKYIGTPYSKIPDPFKCHKSYSEHFEKELELGIKDIISPIEFISQTKKYGSCVYAKEIKKAIDQKEKIREILNKHREEPLNENWYPITIYCEKCMKDSTIIKDIKNYEIEYKCNCGFSNKFDFRKKGIVKLVWRVDWPMRWYFENVDFEPGGKDHSTPGGSYDTGKTIVKEIWEREPPLYQLYDFVIIKNMGGKMSSSSGNVITPKDVLEIYEPELLRYLFVSTRPNKEFFISFDLDVIKNYEDFDRLEKNYFDKNLDDKQKRIYELSFPDKIPKKQPNRIPFRHLSTLIQILDIKEIKKSLNIKKSEEKIFENRINCVQNWIKKYAPEEMKFELQDKPKHKFNEKEKEILYYLAEKLNKKKYDENSLSEEFYNISKASNIDPKEFFKLVYRLLINKEKGPKLAPFILLIGPKKVTDLIEKV